MQKKNNSKRPDIKAVINTLLKDNFFNEWRTVSDVIKKLNSKGFTVKGKKIGMVSRLLTQMCQNLENHFEREEIPKEKRIRNEHWMFQKVK